MIEILASNMTNIIEKKLPSIRQQQIPELHLHEQTQPNHNCVQASKRMFAFSGGFKKITIIGKFTTKKVTFVQSPSSSRLWITKLKKMKIKIENPYTIPPIRTYIFHLRYNPYLVIGRQLANLSGTNSRGAGDCHEISHLGQIVKQVVTLFISFVFRLRLN